MNPLPDFDAVGAQVGDGGVRYCAWAPDLASLAVRVEGAPPRDIALSQDERGYWRGRDPAGRAGDRYFFVLPDGRTRPDPASRFQPEGVHAASECIDARAYAWSGASWRRPRWTGQVIYEIHIGTFTSAGTYRAAIAKLDHVRGLGAEAIELMPLGDFPGERNWGYDGVDLYAPARCYGRPDDLRALVNAAHARGLAVILDVVYNHLGPIGNYLADFCRDYFHADRHTPWGAGFNLDGPRSRPVRDFVLGNAAYWLDDFQIDGLRIDASHAIEDHSPTHLLAKLSAVVHARGGFLIAEDNRNGVELLRGTDGRGFQFDGAWSDDFHHEVRVALTGVREAYYGSYRGSLAELAATLEHGWFYRGQPFPFWKNRPRGDPCAHLPPAAFVICIENHDQVGNRAAGERLEHLVSPEQFRAASMLLCLSPYAPMIFMGQEWAASAPFLFFTDHAGEQGRLVSAGRKKEFADNGLNPEGKDVPDPQDRATFERSKLDWAEVSSEIAASPHQASAPRNAEGDGHRRALALYRACLTERGRHLRDHVQTRARWRVAVAGDAVVVRYDLPAGAHALVFAPRAGDAAVASAAALKLPDGMAWRIVLDSEGTETGAAWSGKFAQAGAVWLAARKKENAPCR